MTVFDVILTTDTRLKIRNIVTDLFKGRNMTNVEKIDYAVNRVCLELENKDAGEIRIDNDIIVGAETPIAMLLTGPFTPVMKDGKKYMSYSDDYICVFASTNYAKLVKCSTPVSRPNGWGDEEDCIVGNPIYVTATCRDMDGIYDTMYYD